MELSQYCESCAATPFQTSNSMNKEKTIPEEGKSTISIILVNKKHFSYSLGQIFCINTK